MSSGYEGKYRKKILTIPNILSFFRLCLVPVMLWTYCVKENYAVTTGLLVLSGLTDIVDGLVARRFHMVSELGKALDPVADKLTQIAVMVCLAIRFPHIFLPLILLTIKEIISAVTNLLIIKRKGEVRGAVWHGKVNTALLYLMMLVHLVWYDIPASVSDGMILVCTGMILLSAVLYQLCNLRFLRER